MRILINTPRLIPQGGVANHYIGLQNYWNEDVIYNQIGRVRARRSGIWRLPINIISYIKLIVKFKPNIILLNPSLYRSAIVRDLIFLKIGKMFNIKVAVFFHGFNISENNITNINIKRLVRNLNQCACVFVLANNFADTLVSWGVVVPIYLTTTKVDNKLIRNFDINIRTGNIQTILFLARITKDKGIDIAIKAFNILRYKYPYLKLRIVGDGAYMDDAKLLCNDLHIKNVFFTGVLTGDNLINEYCNADLYILPTHHEGMPTSVLEAMAFGLPIVSRPVGGLCDFFSQDCMGRLIDSFNPKDYADAIEYYINNPNVTRKVSILNHNYAKKNFLASSVAKSLEDILKHYI